MDCALALAKRGHPVKVVCVALGVARSNVCNRVARPADWIDRRTLPAGDPAEDARLAEVVRTVVGEAPTHCYRQATVLLNRHRTLQGLAPVNHKRVYRVMKAFGMLHPRAAQHAGIQPADADGTGGN